MYRKAGVDTVVFDIADVGSRFYTYIWSMYTAMVAAAETGAAFVVLDRPNPVGGKAYGPMLDPAFASGVGRKPIVQQHQPPGADGPAGAGNRSAAGHSQRLAQPQPVGVERRRLLDAQPSQQRQPDRRARRWRRRQVLR